MRPQRVWFIQPFLVIDRVSILANFGHFGHKWGIGHFRNVRGLGKSMVVFRLIEKLIHSNERSTKFESLNHAQKYLEEENGKMVALQISPKIESLYGLGRQATKL